LNTGKKKYLLWTHAGLGDMVYLYCIAKWFLEKGLDVAVMTHTPDLFAPLGIDTVPFHDDPDPEKFYWIKGDYFKRKDSIGTNQYEDLLFTMGIKEEIPLRVEYPRELVRYKINVSKPVCIVKHPDYKISGDLVDLVPDAKLFQQVIDKLQGKYYFIQVGKYPDDCNIFSGIDLNLIGKTSFIDLFYLIENSSMVLTRTGHLLPMAEALGRKVICVLSKKIARSKSWIINTITPEKVRCGNTSLVLWEDDQYFMEKVLGFFRQRDNIPKAKQAKDRRHR